MLHICENNIRSVFKMSSCSHSFSPLALSCSHCSLRSIFLQKKQEFAENTANTIRQVISQLQEWSQTVQAGASSPSQVTTHQCYSIYTNPAYVHLCNTQKNSSANQGKQVSNTSPNTAEHWERSKLFVCF